MRRRSVHAARLSVLLIVLGAGLVSGCKTVSLYSHETTDSRVTLSAHQTSDQYLVLRLITLKA